MFLGLALQYLVDKLAVHQKYYIEPKLDREGQRMGVGRATPQHPMKASLRRENQDEPGYPKRLKDAHTEVGVLMWLSIKSRPDISASVSTAASLASNNPTEAVRLTEGIWRYFGCNMGLRVVYIASVSGGG